MRIISILQLNRSLVEALASLGTGEEPVLPRALLWPFSDHVTKHRPGVLGSKGTARSSCCSPIQTMLKAPGAPELPVLMATLTPKVSMGLFSPARASHATQDFPRSEGGWLLGDSARACSGGVCVHAQTWQKTGC